MKRGFNIVLITLLGIIALGCSKTKSYTDYLKDEKKAIDRVINRYDLDIINDLPDNMQFDEKQFVKLDNGIYMHVIDSGNGEKAVVGTTTLLTRFVAHILDIDSISLTYNNLYYNFDFYEKESEWETVYTDLYSLDFKYGASAVSSTDMAISYFQSVGLSTPLDYLGDSCVVSLIVPFAAGSYNQMTSYFPIYYSEIRYIFEK